MISYICYYLIIISDVSTFKQNFNVEEVKVEEKWSKACKLLQADNTSCTAYIHTCLTLHNHPNPNTLFQFGYFPKVTIYPSVLTMPSHCPASTSPPFLSPHHPPAGFSRSFAHHSSIALCIHICEDWRGWSLNGKLSLFCRCYNHSKELSDWTNNCSWEMWTEG